MADYFHYIEEADLIQQLRNPAKGICALGKVLNTIPLWQFGLNY